MNENYKYNHNFIPNGDYGFPIPDGVTESRRPQIDWPTSPQKKIGVTPGAIFGAIVGGLMAKNNIEKENEKRVLQENVRRNKEMPRIDGNYYNQVNSVANNLKVVFTPVSAIYTVNNKNKPFTLDTIETNEMNSDMKMAWKNKNEEYFKNLLMSKMYSEMQIAEQGFTKNFVRKQLGIKDSISKDASDTSFLDDISEVDLISLAKKSGEFFIGNDIKEKLASAVVSDMENDSEVEHIDLVLERPFTKYAGFITGIKSSLGLNSSSENIKEIKRKLENPGYVMSNIKVGFFPDRVVFSLENQLVSTLPLISMNEDGYQHFIKQDIKYFKNYFVNNIKNMVKQSNEVTIESAIEKLAEVNIAQTSYSNCIQSSDTHPVVLYLFITSKLGVDWLTYDIGAIESIIKKEFNVEDIPESNLNKIMTILVANQSESPYTNAYAFEKTILSLSSKSVDFLSSEKDNVKIQDIAFTIDALDRVTPYDDIYDNFSREAVNYICDVLSDQEIYIYNPTSIVGSLTEPMFNQILNEALLKAIKGKMTLSSDDAQLDEEINSKCEYIADNSMIILKSIRRYMADNPNMSANQMINGDLIDVIISKKSIKQDLSAIIKRQVVLNMALDSALDFYNKTIQNQLSTYNIVRPEGE